MLFEHTLAEARLIPRDIVPFAPRSRIEIAGKFNEDQLIVSRNKGRFIRSASIEAGNTHKCNWVCSEEIVHWTSK